jgi:glutaredoxin
MFYSDTFPQIIQSLSLSKGKMLSGFAIGHPGQRQVPQIVLDKVVEAMLIENTHQLYKY